MPIKTKISGQEANIIDIITKVGGQVYSHCPLKSKINGIDINFISYGYDITAIICLEESTFDSNKLSQTFEVLSSSVDNIIVNFAPGAFICNSPIVIRTSNVTLIGNNSCLSPNFTNGTDFPNASVIKVSGSSGTPSLRITNICIENFHIYCNNLETMGISAQYVGTSTPTYTPGITIKNCVISHSKRNSINILLSSNNTIYNNSIYGNIGDYSSMYLSNITDTSISSNYLLNGDNSGIISHYSQALNITNNIIQNTGGYGSGVYLIEDSNCNVSKNNMENNNNSVQVINSKNIIVSNNTLNNTQSSSIILTGANAENTIVTNNMCHHSASSGIWATAKHNIISNNHLRRNIGSDLYLDSTSDNIVSGNMIGYYTEASGSIYNHNTRSY